MVSYMGIAWWSSRHGNPGAARHITVLGIFFIAGWLLLDGRWQFNLVRQIDVTAKQYAGKTWRERHLAAEDGQLFAFVEKVRAKLPPPPRRVFVVADEHYFRDRASTSTPRKI
jgi:hypothetical protein